MARGCRLVRRGSASRRKRGLRMDSSGAGVTVAEAMRCGLSSRFFGHLLQFAGGARTLRCICSKQFGYKNGLIRHVRLTHVGEKPYQCSICNRRFGYKHILTEHQNLHFGTRPYACQLCDKRFAARCVQLVDSFQPRPSRT